MWKEYMLVFDLVILFIIPLDLLEFKIQPFYIQYIYIYIYTYIYEIYYICEINDISTEIRVDIEKVCRKNDINLSEIYKTLSEYEHNSSSHIPMSPPQICPDTSSSNNATNNSPTSSIGLEDIFLKMQEKRFYVFLNNYNALLLIRITSRLMMICQHEQKSKIVWSFCF